MRVLLTNHALDLRGGSELYAAEVATRLVARGHSPVVFSPCLGEVAAALREATVPVVDDLGAVGEPPDLIHAHHHLEAMTALLHFPGVPAVYFCHGWKPWEETPLRFPRILRYVAVDELVRERLVSEHGIAPGSVEVLLNFVDLARFVPRSPLPPAPRRAFVFSNQASEHTYLPAVREACRRRGISQVDAAGRASGNPTDRPEALLPGYDLVFAKGRAALEALAVGAAVVLCDDSGAGPLVTRQNLDGLRRLNFGIRTLSRPVEPEWLAAEIRRYDPADAAEVSRTIRATAGIEAAVDRIVEIYGSALGEWRRGTPPGPAEEGRAASAYLRWLNPYFKDRARLVQERDGLRAQAERLHGLALALQRESEDLREERPTGETTAWRLRVLGESAADEAFALRRALRAMEDTATWRLRSRLLRVAPLARLYRLLRRSEAKERAAPGRRGAGP